MKTPDEIKKGLKHCAGLEPCMNCPYSELSDRVYTCETELFKDALAYIQQLEAELDAPESNKFQYETGFLKGFEAAYPKWISVKERLPEPFVSVLVHIPEEEPLPQVHEGYITPDGTWCSVLYVETYDRVAHWMPLPEPPKEDE